VGCSDRTTIGGGNGTRRNIPASVHERQNHLKGTSLLGTSGSDAWIILKQDLRLSNSTLSLDPAASEKYPSHILVEAVI